jgi:hypothetical protein
VQDFAPRLLDFPVRTAAIDSFLADLRAKRIGDIAALQAVLGDSALWDDLLGFWLDRGWIRPAPHSPIHVFPGEGFTSDVTLREFCGEDIEMVPAEEIPGPAH